jgi:hypothetical protein
MSPARDFVSLDLVVANIFVSYSHKDADWNRRSATWARQVSLYG